MRSPIGLITSVVMTLLSFLDVVVCHLSVGTRRDADLSMRSSSLLPTLFRPNYPSSHRRALSATPLCRLPRKNTQTQRSHRPNNCRPTRVFFHRNQRNDVTTDDERRVSGFEFSSRVRRQDSRIPRHRKSSSKIGSH